MEKIGPDGPKWGQEDFFLLIQTLPTFWAERILILRIFIFLIFVGSQISGLGPAWARLDPQLGPSRGPPAWARLGPTHLGPAWARPLGPGVGPPTWARRGPTHLGPAWAHPLGPGVGPPTWAQRGPTHLGPAWAHPLGPGGGPSGGPGGPLGWAPREGRDLSKPKCCLLWIFGSQISGFPDSWISRFKAVI